MISVFYNNKYTLYRGNDTNESTTKEDILTAALFDLLKYLPYDIFWSILKNALLKDKLPIECGEIKDIIFWPKWDTRNTSVPNKRYIEPDVFIRTNTFDLIVEAKRYDRNQQNDSQLKSEVIAYNNEYADDNKSLYFIQLGGLQDLDDIQNFTNAVICKTDWTKLLDQIHKEYKKIESISYSQINAYKRILEDLMKVLEVHGFYKTLWLQSLENERKNNNADNFKFYEYAKRK